MTDYDAVMNSLPQITTEENTPEVIAKKVIEAANSGNGVLAVSMGAGDTEEAHGEYTDVQIEMLIQAGFVQIGLKGSTISLNEIWTILELYGKRQTEASIKAMARAEKQNENPSEEQSEEEPLPALMMMFIPDDEVFGDYYAEADMPIMWAFSAEGQGRPANQLRIAFPVSMCNIFPLYDDEDDNDGNTDDLYTDIVDSLVTSDAQNSQ